jgi:hypothetical protein
MPSNTPTPRFDRGHDNTTSEEWAARAACLVGSEPMQPWLPPRRLTQQGFDRLPRAYIECLRDRAIPLELERLMGGRHALPRHQHGDRPLAVLLGAGGNLRAAVCDPGTHTTVMTSQMKCSAKDSKPGERSALRGRPQSHAPAVGRCCHDPTMLSPELPYRRSRWSSPGRVMLAPKSVISPSAME